MERVCCMCGDVGFSDKLFRCVHCRNRFQHSYCSNYYSEFAEPIEYCDWCRKFSTDTSKKAASLSSNSSLVENESNRTEYSSGGGIKHNNRHEPLPKIGGGVPSPTPTPTPTPRTPTRRYKLLKDVMC